MRVHAAACAAAGLLLAAALAGCAGLPGASVLGGPPAPAPGGAEYPAAVQALLEDLGRATARVAAANGTEERAQVYLDELTGVRAARAQLGSLAPPAGWDRAHAALATYLEALEAQSIAGVACADGVQEKCAEEAEFSRIAGEALRIALASVPAAGSG